MSFKPAESLDAERLLSPASPSARRTSVPEISGTRLWYLTLAVGIILLLLPLFASSLPPLLDYPNHLARMAILSRGADDPALHAIYRARWGIFPNMGMDLIVPELAWFMPLAWAGKVFIALALVLPVLGCVALHHALFQRRTYWPLASMLVAYSGPLLAGFLNFVAGAGIALLAAAVWQRQLAGPVWRRAGIGAIAVIITFFCHIVAVAFLGLLLASLELARGGAMRQRALRLGAVVLALAPALALFLAAPIRHAAPTGGSLLWTLKLYYWALMNSPMKLVGLLGPFLTYDLPADVAAAALIIALLLVWAIRGRLLVNPAAAIAFCAILLAYPLTPFVFMDTAWVDQRLPILGALVLFAGTMPLALPRQEAIAVAAVAMGLFVVRIGVIVSVWTQHEVDVAAMSRVIAPIRPGDRVLVARSEDATDPDPLANERPGRRFMIDVDSMAHLPSLVVIERHAFIPILFSNPMKQPMEVEPPYDRLAFFEGAPPFARALTHPTRTDLAYAPYLARWQEDFDWVLLLRPDKVPGSDRLAGALLQRVEYTDTAALYRVIKGP